MSNSNNDFGDTLGGCLSIISLLIHFFELLADLTSDDPIRRRNAAWVLGIIGVIIVGIIAFLSYDEREQMIFVTVLGGLTFIGIIAGVGWYLWRIYHRPA